MPADETPPAGDLAVERPHAGLPPSSLVACATGERSLAKRTKQTMPRGVKKTELEREAHKATLRVFEARRAYEQVRRRLDAAIADEAVAVYRVELAERFRK